MKKIGVLPPKESIDKKNLIIFLKKREFRVDIQLQ